MKAFNNDPKIKKAYLNRIQKHKKAGEIVKGVGWKDGKGSAVGCTIHSLNYNQYESELGITRVLAHIEDSIFETIPDDLANSWPESFLKSIKPGADLSKVWNKFAAWLLIGPDDGVINFASTDRTKEDIYKIGNLYALSINEEIGPSRWRVASDSAYSSAYAAYDMREAQDVALATYAATAAAAAAGAYFARDYDPSYAEFAVSYATMAHPKDFRSKARIKQADKLLELLRDSK